MNISKLKAVEFLAVMFLFLGCKNANTELVLNNLTAYRNTD